jgi:hypothetical protein
MRLLYLDSDKSLCIEEFFGNNVPSYAILSHTWGPAGSEVTYKDISQGTGKGKAGYEKIRFCGEKATSHSLKYFWVDTCCIDKSNSTELQQAITSMFRWYHDAARCYVYMSDVSTSDCDMNIQSSQLPWESAFREADGSLGGGQFRSYLHHRPLNSSRKRATDLATSTFWANKFTRLRGLLSQHFKAALWLILA